MRRYAGLCSTLVLVAGAALAGCDGSDPESKGGSAQQTPAAIAYQNVYVSPDAKAAIAASEPVRVKVSFPGTTDTRTGLFRYTDPLIDSDPDWCTYDGISPTVVGDSAYISLSLRMGDWNADKQSLFDYCGSVEIPLNALIWVGAEDETQDASGTLDDIMTRYGFPRDTTE